MEWENGEETWEPLFTAKKDGIGDQNPVEVALYAKKNNLLNTPGWMSPRIRSLAKSQKKLIQTAIYWNYFLDKLPNCPRGTFDDAGHSRTEVLQAC